MLFSSRTPPTASAEQTRAVAAAPETRLLIFDCPSALQADDCGRRLCSSGCTIRASVAATHHTGQTQHHIPAVQRQRPGEHSDAELLIA